MLVIELQFFKHVKYVHLNYFSRTSLEFPFWTSYQPCNWVYLYSTGLQICAHFNPKCVMYLRYIFVMCCTICLHITKKLTQIFNGENIQSHIIVHVRFFLCFWANKLDEEDRRELSVWVAQTSSIDTATELVPPFLETGKSKTYDHFPTFSTKYTSHTKRM